MNVLPASKRRTIALTMISLAVIVAVILSFRSAPIPSVILLPSNTSIAPRGWQFDRGIPISWGWDWRTKDFLLGRPKTVLIEGVVVRGVRRLLPEGEQSFLPP